MKRKTKRRIAILMAVVLAVMALGACGKGESQPKGTAPAASTTEAPTDAPAATPDENASDQNAAATPAPEAADANNDDLMKDGIGPDYGYGAVGYDLDALVARMGDKVSKLRIGVSVNNQNNDWQKAWISEFQKFASKYGFELIVTSADDDDVKFVDDVHSLANQQVDGMIVFPVTEAAALNVVSDLYGVIPVVPAIPIAGAKVPVYIDVDQEAKGHMIGEKIVEAVGDKETNILVMDITGTTEILQKRIRGMEAAIAGHDNIKIAEKRQGETAADMLSAAKDILNANESINVIFATYGVPLLAAANAVEQLGIKDRVLVYGVDGDQAILQSIVDGRIDGTHPQWPQVQASICLFAALRAINGDNLPEVIYESDTYAMLYADKTNAADISKKMWE